MKSKKTLFAIILLIFFSVADANVCSNGINVINNASEEDFNSNNGQVCVPAENAEIDFRNTGLKELIETSNKTMPDNKSGFNYAYFGIAGQGGGMGAMGHAFFALAKEEGQMHDASVYQFNLEMNTNPQTGKQKKSMWNDIKNLQDSRHILLKQNARKFIDKYTTENRVVLLFKIKLNKIEVNDLYHALETEKIKREQIKHTDYSVIKNNCLTQNIDILNNILQEQQFESSWRKGKIDLSSKISLDTLTTNIPLTIAPTLEKHPLFDKPILYKPMIHQVVKVGVLIRSNLDKLSKTCSWSNDKTKTIAMLLLNKNTSETHSFMNYFKKEVIDCNNSKATNSFNEILDLLIFNSNSAMAIISEYYL